jgi:hypothetical protein
MERLFYRPKDAAVALGMSRTAVFRLIRTGELRSIERDGYRLRGQVGQACPWSSGQQAWELAEDRGFEPRRVLPPNRISSAAP